MQQQQQMENLWGLPGVGKSTFIEKLIDFENKGHAVYMPTPGDFFMEGYRPFHKVIVFEEFDWERWRKYSAELKLLFEGRKFTVRVKYELDRLVEHVGPVILVSNAFDINDCAYDRRLKTVCASDPYWNLEFNEAVEEVCVTPDIPSASSYEACSWLHSSAWEEGNEDVEIPSAQVSKRVPSFENDDEVSSS